MNVRVLRSTATQRNSVVVPLGRTPDEDNIAWLERARRQRVLRDVAGRSLLVLVGGNDLLSFRLRVAQSHVRHDLSPSAWSHVAFLRAPAKSLADAELIEISLMPVAGFGPWGDPAPNNALQSGRLETYRSATLFPNVALLSLPLAAADVAASLEDLRFQRTVLDCPQLVLKWLAYCWGVGMPANPLAEGYGMPSAAVLEAAFAANGFDLSPGLESRSSCPEALWQAAIWWQDYYASRGEGPGICGAHYAEHKLVPDVQGGTPAPQPRRAAGRRRSRKRTR